jgi:hypothetical protein
MTPTDTPIISTTGTDDPGRWSVAERVDAPGLHKL